jgi:hypothetical protein
MSMVISGGMQGSARRLSMATFALLAVGTILTAMAFACSPIANVQIAPGGAAAGSTVTVSGAEFLDNRPVVISMEGHQLATATGPTFSTAIQVPELDAGSYVILATTSTADGKSTYTARTSFEVVGPELTPEPAQPTGESTPSAGASQTAAPAATPATTSRPEAGARTPAQEKPAAKPAPRTPAAAASRTQKRTTAPATRPATGATATADGGQRVFAGSVAETAAPSRRETRKPEPRTTAKVAARPAATAPPATARATPPPPSLLSPAGTADAGDSLGGRLAIGVAFLVLGLMLPLAGFVVAEARRRRAHLRAPSDR